MLGDQLLGIGRHDRDRRAGHRRARRRDRGERRSSSRSSFRSVGFVSGLAIVAAQRIGAHDVDGFARTVRAGLVVPLHRRRGIALRRASWARSRAMHAMRRTPSQRARRARSTSCCAARRSFRSTIFGNAHRRPRRRRKSQTRHPRARSSSTSFTFRCCSCSRSAGGRIIRYGIVGAGISSLLSETIAAIYAVVYAARRPHYRIFRRAARFRLDARAALRAALGFPEVDLSRSASIAPDIFIVAHARAARRDRRRGVPRAQRRLRPHVRRARSAAERDANRHRPAPRRAAIPQGARVSSSARCAFRCS